MKEQEPIENPQNEPVLIQPELTDSPNSLKLEKEETIFMADENGEGPKPPQESPDTNESQPSNDDPIVAHRNKIRNQWNESFPLPDDTPYFVRDIINAAIESGFGPDRMSEDEMRVLRNMANRQPDYQQDQDLQSSAASGGGGDGGNRKPPNPPVNQSPQDSDGDKHREEELTPKQVFDEIDRTLNELPKKIRDRLLIKFKTIGNLSEEERIAAYREFLTDLSSAVDDTTIQAERIAEKYGKEEKEDARPEDIHELKVNAREKIDAIVSNLDSIISGLGTSSEADQQILAYIMGNEDVGAMVTVVAKQNIDEINRQRDYIQGIIKNSEMSADDKKTQLQRTFKVLSENYLSAIAPVERDPYNPVRSVQELGKYIAETHGTDLWGEDGIHPIIDREGKFHPENMVLWVREQTNKMHTDNRNDAISPLGSIHVRIGLGDVNLYEMVRINRQRYMRDAETGQVLDDLAEELVYEAWGFGQVRNFDLAYNQVMREDRKLPEGIMQIHARNDLTRGDTLRKLSKMAEKYGKDAKVGRAALMANDIYYNLSDWAQLVEILGGEDAVGFSKRFSNKDPEIVRQIESDLGSLHLSRNDYSAEFKRRYEAKIIQEIGNIKTFTKGDFEDAIRIIQGKKDWETIDSYEGFYDSSDPGNFYCTDTDANTGKKVKHELFDSDGRFNIVNFVRYMNIYNYATPEESMLNLVKELVRLKSAQKMELGAGIERTPSGKDAKKLQWLRIVEDQISLGRNEKQAQSEADRQILSIQRHAERISIEFAEHLAYALQRPYGGAARNDANRRGFNALTKLNLEDYITRQSAAERAGPVGVREAVGLFRNVGPDLWTALRTETRESPLEIFRMVRGIENSPVGVLRSRYEAENRVSPDYAGKSEEEKIEEINKLREGEIKYIIDRLRFAEGAEADVASNVQARGFQIFHAQTGGERLDLDKLVTYDPMRGVQINIAEMEEKFNDGFIKPSRYFGSVNGGMKFSSQVRRLNLSESRKRGVPVYENVSLAENSYSPEVLDEFNNYINAKGRRTIDFDNLEVDPAGKDYIDYGPGRMGLVKVAQALELGAILHSHRAFRGPSQRWGYVRNEAFFAMLRSQQEMEPDPDHPGRQRIVRDENGKPKRYFDDELIKLIRKRGDAKSWKLFLEDVGIEAGGPFALSLLEMLIMLTREVVKD